MKIFIYSVHGFDRPFLEKASNNKHQLLFTEQKLSIDTVGLSKGCEAIAIFSCDNASAEVLKKLAVEGIKFIALRSVGFDHVDLATTKNLGLKVANVPAYSPYAIAEHSVALLLAINRKIILSQTLIKQNDFRLDSLIGYDLHGKTIGIVGTGKIGSAFASIMYGFGCKLLAFDIEENTQLKKNFSIVYTSLENLCKESDVVSINCPLNSKTKYMFNKSLFAKMRKNSIFINTARGGIVNTLDLLEALDNGSILGAGLDVYENEKTIFFKNHLANKVDDTLFEKLMRHPKVLLTAHQAFLTKEALSGIAKTTFENINSWEMTGFSKNDL